MTGRASDLPGVRCLQQGTPCQLWSVQLDGEQGDAWEVLSAEEQTRARRFVFQPHQQRYVRARASLRHLLGEVTGEPADRLRIALGHHGKPYLPDHPACHFNLAHSAGMALIAISRVAEIGVDLEPLQAVADLAALCDTTFTIKEQKQVFDASDEGMDSMFLRGWTRKEACLKAIGTGLQIAPNTFDAGFSQDAVVHIQGAASCHAVTLQSIDVGPAWVAAFAQLH
jgi:4'-phosphopantetheinyl transferase